MGTCTKSLGRLVGIGIFLFLFLVALAGLWGNMTYQIRKESYSVRQAAWLMVSYRGQLLPLSWQSSFWQLIDRVLRLVYDTLIFVLGFGADFVGIQQAAGGLPAPFYAGFVTWNYDEVASHLQSAEQLRGRYLSTSPVHPKCFGNETLIFLSNGDRHTQLKQIIVEGIRGFHINETSLEQRRQIQWMGEPPLDPKKYHTDDEISRYVMATMFFRLFGQVPKPSDIDLFTTYMSLVPFWLFGQDAANIVPSIPERVEAVRNQIYEIVLPTPGGASLLRKAREVNEETKRCQQAGRTDCPPWVSPEETVLQIVDGFLFAGVLGGHAFTSASINRMRSNPARYYPLYKADPHKFLKEVARLSPPVSSVTAVLPEKREVLLGTGMSPRRGDTSGKLSHANTLTFPKHNPYEICIATANRDPKVFGHTADYFDPNRPNLDLILSWNGVEKEVVAHKAPRGCPGHDVSLDVLQTFLDYFAHPDMEPNPDSPRAAQCETMRFENVLIYSHYTYPPEPWVVVVSLIVAIVWPLGASHLSKRLQMNRFAHTPWTVASSFLSLVVIGHLLHSEFTIHLGVVLSLTWLLQLAISHMFPHQFSFSKTSNATNISTTTNSTPSTISTTTNSTPSTISTITNSTSSSTSSERTSRCSWFVDSIIGTVATLILWLVATLAIAFVLIGSFAFGEYFLGGNQMTVLVYGLSTLLILTVAFTSRSQSGGFGLLLRGLTVVAVVARVGYAYPGIAAWLVAFVAVALPVLLSRKSATESQVRGRDLTSLLVLIVFVLLLWQVGPLFLSLRVTPVDPANPIAAVQSQLDYHTAKVYELTAQAGQQYHSNPRPTALSVGPPVRTSELVMVEVMPFGWYVPIDDEDYPHENTFDRILGDLRIRLFQLLPFKDLTASFKSPEEARSIGRAAGKYMADDVPKDLDLVSDQAMTRWAFYGLAAHLVRRVGKESLGQPKTRENEKFVVDLNWMHGLEVRESFDHYGGAAYFDQDKKIVRIAMNSEDQSAGLIDYYPGQKGWEHAKFKWRSSVMTGVTLKDHLCRVHLKYSNVVVWAARETLPIVHPVRILLTPFSFGTIQVNSGAAVSLSSPKGILHRATALTLDSLNEGFRIALQTEYDFFGEDQIQQGLEAEVPFVEDFKAFKSIVQQFVHDYLHVYYLSDQQVLQDEALGCFIGHIESADIPLPPITSLAELEAVIVEYILVVTVVHHHVGTVNEYVVDPTSCSSKIRPQATMADVQSTFQLMIMAIFTSFPQPKLINDWTHILVDTSVDQTRPIFQQFQQNLIQLSDQIKAKNLHRLYPVNSVNPSEISSSVSI